MRFDSMNVSSSQNNGYLIQLNCVSQFMNRDSKAAGRLTKSWLKIVFTCRHGVLKIKTLNFTPKLFLHIRRAGNLLRTLLSKRLKT